MQVFLYKDDKCIGSTQVNDVIGKRMPKLLVFYPDEDSLCSVFYLHRQNDIYDEILIEDWEYIIEVVTPKSPKL